MHEGFAFNKTDPAARPLEEPKIAIAGYIDQTLIESAATFEIHEDWRRDFVPIPGFVRSVLVMTLDRPGARIDCYC